MRFVQRYQDLLKRVEAAVDSALEQEVSEAVKDVMEEQTGYQVYSYEATEVALATRRVENGGLGDRRNMVSSVHSAHELTVENVAPFQGDPADYMTLSDVVEQGKDGFQQPYPRTFVSGTEQEAVSSGRALNALRQGMKRQGL